jgi:predicted  nucleic acid-binding Zn-ribbon protein
MAKGLLNREVANGFHTVHLLRMKLRVGMCPAVALLLLLSGCKGVYYSTWEKFGVYKRDLLKKKIEAARDDQKAAGDQFKDALTRLKEMYGFQGGDLEKTYNALNHDYEKCVDRANTVHQRIKDVESVAGDLFAEWEKEIKEISSDKLRDDSRDKLRETRRRYEELHASLKRAEKSMDPVLTRFHDQVLYLKHNLNAAAIASLKGETTDIQAEIGKLVEEMNRAIAQADSFISTLK